MSQVQIYDTYEEAMSTGGSASPPTNPGYNSQQYRAYKRRWYILAAYSLLAFNQGLIWNTWGPLKDAMQSAYLWGTFEFGMLPNWAPIGFVLALAPSLLIVRRFGLKIACLFGAGLMAAGTVAPCFLARDASLTNIFTIVCHIDALLCGLACPVAMALPPALSAVWFPPSQRVLSTSIATLSNYIGSAFSFQFGRLFVPNSNASVANATESLVEIRRGVANLLYLECGLALAALLLFAAYFPAAPPTPCSASARAERLGFRQCLTRLTRSVAFWSVCLAYSIVGGVNGGFLAAFNLNVESLGVGVEQADAAGFWSVLSAGLVCLPVALLSGRLRNRLKPCLLGLLLLSGCAYLCFSLTCLEILPRWPALIFAASCAGSIFLYSAVPFFFELAADSAYPAPESVVCGLLTLGNNLVAMAFLGLVAADFGADSHGRMLWINWTMTGVCFAALLALFFAPAALRRDLADQQTEDLGQEAAAEVNAVDSNDDRDGLLARVL